MGISAVEKIIFRVNFLSWNMSTVPNGPRRTSPDLVGQVLVQSSLESSTDSTDQSMLQD